MRHAIDVHVHELCMSHACMCVAVRVQHSCAFIKNMYLVKQYWILLHIILLCLISS